MARDDANNSGSRCKCRTLKYLQFQMNELNYSVLPFYFEDEHEESVLNALQVVETDVLQGKPIHWNMLPRVIRGMRINKETAPHCLKFAIELVNLFERYQCKDVSVMSEVFIFMQDLCTLNYEFTGGDPPSERNKSFQAAYGDESELDMVWNAVKTVNLGLLKLQLKFGMVMMTPRFASSSFIKCMVLMHALWGRYSPIERVEDAVLEEKFRRDLNSESRKRMCLVFRMLTIVVVTVFFRFSKERVAECYKLIFESIPEPYISCVELKAFLERYLPDTYSKLIHQVTEDFKLLPELAQVPQPRSLQHLCRIQVRDSLRQNLNLPYGVSSLPLPTILKEYITLNDDANRSVFRETRRKYPWRSDNYFSCFALWDINIPEVDDCITTFLKNL